MLKVKRILSAVLAVALMLSIIPNTMLVANAVNGGQTDSSELSATYHADTGKVQVDQLPATAVSLILAGYQKQKFVFAELEKNLTGTPVEISVPEGKNFDTLKVFCLDQTGSPVCEAKLVYLEGMGECSVDYVAFEETEGQFNVSLSAAIDCMLQLQIVDEVTNAVLHTGTVEIVGMEKQQTVSYAPEAYVFPEFFVLTAVLTTEAGDALCNPYTYLEQTQKYQNAIAKTVDDFDAESVVKLSETTKQNFLVASEDTQILNLSDTYSVEVAEETGVVIIYGDIAALNLETNNKKYMVVYQDEVFLVNASSVSIGENHVVLTEDTTAELIDFVDFVKIDQQAKGVGEETSDHLELLGEGDVTGNQVGTFKKIELCLQPNDNYKYKVSLGGDSTLDLKILIDKKDDIFIFEAKYANTIEFTVGVVTDNDPIIDDTVKDGKFLTFDLGRVEYPIAAGVEAYAEVKVPVTLDIEGKAEFTYEIKQETMIKYDFTTNTWTETNDQDSVTGAENEVKVTFETGLEMTLGVGFLESVIKEDEYSVSVSGTISALFIATLGTAMEADTTGAEHACYLCLEGDVKVELKVNATIKFFITEKIQGKLIDVDLCKLTIRLKEYYISVLNPASSVHGGRVKGGDGKCPNITYNTTISAIDLYGNVYSKPLAVTGSFQMSDGKTTATYQSADTVKLSNQLKLHNGTYQAAVQIGGVLYARDFKVQKKAQSFNILEYILTGNAWIPTEGLALRDASVTLFTFDGTIVAESKTDGKGKMEITFQLPVGYEMLYAKIEKAGIIPYYAGFSIPNETGMLNLHAAPVEHIDSRSSVAGVVQGSDGKALAGVVVELYDASGALVYTDKTNDCGVYQFATALSAGNYQLKFVKSGYSYDASTTIQVGSSQITSFNTVTMEDAGEQVGYLVSGVVCNTEGDPLQGVQVHLTGADGSYTKAVQTDRNGKFIIVQPSECGFTLHFLCDGYQDTSNMYSAGTMDIGTKMLIATHTLKGAVTGSNGKTLSGAMVIVQKEDGTVYDWQYAASDGTFRFSVVYTGNYTVVVSNDGYESSQRAVLIESAVTEVAFLLKKIPAALSVTHATYGDVLALAAQLDATGGIPLYNGAGSAHCTVTGATNITKTGDWFTISQADNGTGGVTLTITVTGKTLTRNDGTIIFTKEDGTTHTVKVHQKAYAVNGMVKDSAGAIANVAVVVWNQDGFRSDTLYTAADGSFRVPVYDGAYNVTVTTEEYGEKNFVLESPVNMCDVTAVILLEHPNGSCGENVTWALSKDGVLTISGSGDMYDYSSVESVPWYAYRNDITKLVVQSGVTSIGQNAFTGCMMTDISLPGTLKVIESFAFTNTVLTSFSIPEGVEQVKTYPFSGNHALQSIYIPASVTYIGGIGMTNGLLEITVSPDNENYCSIDGVLFNKAATRLYKYPQGRTDVTYEIPDGVEATNHESFSASANLVNIVVPESITSMNTSFSYCSGLSRMYFMGDMPSLDRTLCNLDVVLYYIEGKEGWTSPTVTDSNGYVYNTETFDPDNMNLEEYIVAEGTCNDDITWVLDSTETLTISGAGMMPNYSYPNDAPWYGQRTNIKAVKVEEGIESLGQCAFYDCYNLTTLTLPASLKAIGAYAFDRCSGLQSFTVPSGVSSIGDGALRCANLKEIVVDPANEHFEAEEGVLFTKNKTALVKYPGGKGDYQNEADWHYVIPDGVQIVEDDAFTDAISSQGGVYEWEDGTVIYLGLVSITFPESVTTIAWDDYRSPYQYVQDLYFEGTVPESSTGYTVAGGKAMSVIHFYWDQTETNSNHLLLNGWTSSIWTAPDTTVYRTVCEDAVAAVIGSIVDTAGKPIEDVEVRLYDTSRNAVPVYTVSFEDGRYGFQIGESGTYILELIKAGYEIYTAQLVIDDSINIIDTITLPESSTIASGTYRTAAWTLNVDGTLTVSGNGSVPDRAWNIYKDQVIELSVESGITSISLTDSNSYVDGVMYNGYDNLQIINLSETVTACDMDTYGHWSALTTITVSKDNPAYSAVDGVLYSKDGSTLIKYPLGKTDTSFIVPDGVSAISTVAFKYVENLQTISFPESLRSIGAEAFYGATITSLTLPSGVTMLEDQAFYNAYRLQTVYLSDTVAELGTDVFDACGSLQAFTVDTSNEAFTAEDGVLFNSDMTSLLCYPPCKSDITVYEIPATVVSLPCGIESDYLTEIKIGRNVADIGAGFEYCRRLESIAVSSLNNTYSAADGVLFDKSKETILRYPGAKTGREYTIPDTVVTIGASAFYNCDNLTEVHLPASVDTMERNAFGYCDKLASLYFYGNAPTNWADYALGYTTNASLVIYYIDGMTGWTSGTWKAPDGKSYTTVTFTP